MTNLHDYETVRDPSFLKLSRRTSQTVELTTTVVTTTVAGQEVSLYRNNIENLIDLY